MKTIEFKVCSDDSCLSKGVPLHISYFYRLKLNLDGYNNQCKDCVKSKVYSWKNKNPDKVKIINSKCHQKNKNRYSPKKQVWAKNNRDKTRASIANWTKNNRNRVNSNAVNHRAIKNMVTPPWAKQMMKNYMPLMYKFQESLIKMTGKKYQIDHIVPIKGRAAQGLHLPWNLQFLPEIENKEKSNKFVPYVENINLRSI